MTHDKLRGWLNLPDGPWPPDHYALIGLEPGAGTPEEIEGRVLERLDLVRRYQLPHPDEATEGMNLLARALDTLTDPDARRAYDRSIGVRSVTRVVEPPPLPAGDVLNTLFPGIPLLPAEADVHAPAAADEPALGEAFALQPLDEEPDIDDEPDVLTEDPLVGLPETFHRPIPPPLARLADREGGDAHRPRRKRSPRRELYADLARVRKVLRIWEQARPLLTDPDRTFDRRADTLELMGCLAELRPLLPTVTDLIATGHRPGGLVAGLARQRLRFDTFRSLSPKRRDDLARDFRAAHYRLAGYYDDLRDEVRWRTEKDWYRAVGRPVLCYLARRPEWVLLSAAMLSLAVAVARSL